MVIKSLTITEDAYNALKRIKHGDESFSNAILRFSKEKSAVIDKYFGILNLKESKALEWQRLIKQRRKEIENEFEKRQKKFSKILTEHGSA